MKKYLWLFQVNFCISAFTFGGGYVVIPMIRKYFVQQKKIFTSEELIDMAAIAQSSPGAIAINLSVLAGYRTAGMMGAIVSCIAAVFPPLLILSVISSCYQVFRDNHIISVVLKGMEAGVGALIVDIVLDMSKAVFKAKQPLMSCIVPVTFIGSFFLHINVVIIILLCSVVCFVDGWLKKRKKEKGEAVC